MGFRGGGQIDPPPSVSWFSSTPAGIGLISTYPPCKDGNARFTLIPLKPLLPFFLLEKCFILKISKYFFASSYFRINTTINICFWNFKHGYLIHTWRDKAFKGTVVNRTLPSLHRGSLEVAFTVPLITKHLFRLWYFKFCKFSMISNMKP